MKTREIIFFITAILTFIISACQRQNNKTEHNYLSNSPTISTNIQELGKLIDIEKYKPIKIAFRYHVQGEKNNDRVTVPGPTDYALEAVLYFDTATYHHLIYDNMKVSTVNQDYFNKKDYEFGWLDKDIADEIENLMPAYRDEPPQFFMRYPLIHGGYLLLGDKIVLRLYTT
jgi:hypothetical protein